MSLSKSKKTELRDVILGVLGLKVETIQVSENGKVKTKQVVFVK